MDMEKVRISKKTVGQVEKARGENKSRQQTE
jgi:hypothetical protein